MATKALKGERTTRVATSDSSHNSIPFYTWLKKTGAEKFHPATFTPTIGDTSKAFRSNLSDYTIGQTMYNVTNPFFPVQGDTNKGFSVASDFTSSERVFNVEVKGGTGLWMPCAIYGSISFYWKNDAVSDKNWSPRYFAIRAKNAITQDEVLWGSGMYNGNYDSASGRVYTYSNSTYNAELNNLGPGWFVYGIIFNIHSRSQSLFSAPTGRLTDTRLGWQHSGLTGTNRMILPKEMSWNEMCSVYQSGRREYG